MKPTSHRQPEHIKSILGSRILLKEKKIPTERFLNNDCATYSKHWQKVFWNFSGMLKAKEVLVKTWKRCIFVFL